MTLSTQAFKREVAAYLRLYPNVSEIELREGAKHPRFIFKVDGVGKTLTIPSSPGDGENSLKIALGNVRRLVGGPPPEPEKKEKRKLNDMTPTVAEPRSFMVAELENLDTQPKAKFTGTVARYRYDLVFRFDPALASLIGFERNWHVAEVTNTRFILIPDETSSNRRQSVIDGKRAQIRYPIKTPSEIDRYGSSPAQFVLLPSEDRIEVVVTDVRPVIKRALRVRRALSAVEAPEPTTPVVVPAAPVPALSVDKARLVAALSEIAAIETETPYRLTRLAATNEFEWRATVRLPREE